MSYILLLLLIIFINNQLLSSLDPQILNNQLTAKDPFIILTKENSHIINNPYLENPERDIYQYPYIREIGDDLFNRETNENEQVYLKEVIKNVNEVLSYKYSETNFTEDSAIRKLLNQLRYKNKVSFVAIGKNYGEVCPHGGYGKPSRKFFYNLANDFIKNEFFAIEVKNAKLFGVGSGRSEFEILRDLITNNRIKKLENITFMEPRVFIDLNQQNKKHPTLLNLCVYLLQRISPDTNYFAESQLHENGKKIDFFMSIDTNFETKGDYEKTVSGLHDTCSFFWLACDGSIYIFNFKDKRCNYAAVSHNNFVYTFNNFINPTIFSINKKSISSADTILNNINDNIDALNGTEFGIFLNSFFDSLQNSTDENFIRANAFKLSQMYEIIFEKGFEKIITPIKLEDVIIQDFKENDNKDEIIDIKPIENKVDNIDNINDQYKIDQKVATSENLVDLKGIVSENVLSKNNDNKENGDKIFKKNDDSRKDTTDQRIDKNKSNMPIIIGIGSCILAYWIKHLYKKYGNIKSFLESLNPIKINWKFASY